MKRAQAELRSVGGGERKRTGWLGEVPEGEGGAEKKNAERKDTLPGAFGGERCGGV